MRYTAKIASPLETGREWRLPILAEALRARRSLLTAPAGYVSADSLALAARERFSSVAWLRLDPEDSDPASFLDALESGADAALFVGEPHPERPAAPVRRRDWARAFDTKGQQIAARLPSESAIIIENVHHLVGTESTHKLLGRHLIPALGTEVTVLMTTDRPISPRHFRPVVVFGARDLAVDTSHFVQAAERFHAPLAGVSIRRAMKLTEGRVLALGAILLAASTFGPSLVEHAVQQSRSIGELLVRLGGSLISPAGTEARDGLALAALLGYSNARMFEVVLGSRPSLIEPWLVPLTDDWAQLQALWRAPLLDLLRSQIVSSGDAVRRLADQLVLHGVAEVAIPLYLQVGDVTSAARALPSAVDSLVATGRWDAMSRLLARVPAASQPCGLVAAREAIIVADRRPEGRRWGGLTGPVRVRRNASGARHAAPQEDVAWEGVSSSGSTGVAEGPPLTDFHGAPSTSVAERATDASEVVTPRRLTAHLLGSFRVAIDDRPVEAWTSRRGRSICKYLLLHHNEAIHREVLTELLWPHAAADAARNNLNVALHGLRRSLRSAAGDIQVVMYKGGRYCINPDLSVWLDVVEFQDRIADANRLSEAGSLDEAITAYELAASLYTGALFEDEPYEEWSTVARESFRIVHMDGLDRLARLYFDRGYHTACIRVGQQILALDSWREDVHCLLMRCYSRLGQPNLAIRQYRTCAIELSQELRVTPAPTTSELFACVRNGRPI